MHRWTARLLLLLTAYSLITPLTPLSTAQTMGMHCQRKPLGPVQAQAPAMQCHHGMSMAPESSETSFSSRDCCCNHDCCRSSKISEWAQPRLGPILSNPAALATAPHIKAENALAFFLYGLDSARAPPRI